MSSLKNSANFSRTEWLLVTLSGLAILAHFMNLGMMPLIADEGIRAAVSQEMLISGDFLHPTTWGEPYYYKTPLYNWIVAGFFYLFGSSEFVLRLPSVLSLFALGLSMFLIAKKELGTKYSAYAAFAFVLSGRLLTRDSMLGHIDLFFSLVVFLQLYSIYYFHKRKQFSLLFACSYFLMAVGILMKGLPSIAFQVVSLGLWLYLKKDLKKLLSWQHLMGILIATIIGGSYFYFYSVGGDEQTYFQRLYEQSAERSFFRHSPVKVLVKTLSFPFENLLHLFPSSLFLLLVLKKGLFKKIRSNDFANFSFVILVANLIPYWLSPGYYPRYLFMLYPIFFILIFFLYSKSEKNLQLEKVIRVFWTLCSFAMFISLLAGAFMVDWSFLNYSYSIILALLAAVLISSLAYYKKHLNVFSFSFALLIVFRLAFDSLIIPYRVEIEKGVRVEQKANAEKILALSEGEKLGIWPHTPLPQNYAFYLSKGKGEIIKHSYDLQSGNYYLVLEEVAEEKGLKTLYSFDSHYEGVIVHLVKVP